MTSDNRITLIMPFRGPVSIEVGQGVILPSIDAYGASVGLSDNDSSMNF
jgi:hypothetical protein